MNLNILNNVTNDKTTNKEVNSFIEELQDTINKKEINTEELKIDTTSKLNLANNIVKNNKMTTENREKLFLKERSSLYDIYDSNKRAGDLYYIADKGANKDVYVCKINRNYFDEDFCMIKKSELPEDMELGDIYRKKKMENSIK